MKKWILYVGGVLGLLTLIIVSYILGYDLGAQTRTTAEQEALEWNFELSMVDVVLDGFFTVDGQNDPELSVERYIVKKAEKSAGDLWIFHSRIQYGKRDVTIPIPARVLWAGDTPVITLTDANIPGLGIFSARVLFFKDRYAGTWSNPTRGGHQFGVVTRKQTGK